MRNSRRFSFLLAGVFLCACAASQADRETPLSSEAPPNFVFFLVDDLGWGDLGCYGNRVHATPNIDGLALEGMRFTQAYANAPNCAPTRAALMSGQYAPRTGVYTVASAARGKARNRKLVPIENQVVLADSVVTLPEVLAQAGYTCAAFGKWHLGDDPRSQGFDVSVGGNRKGMPPSYFSPYPGLPLEPGPRGEHLTDRLTNEAIAFLKRKRTDPFFLYMSFYAVHTPIQAKRELIKAYRARGAPHPSYAAMLENTDYNVGRLLDTLDTLGLRENTVVMLFSDNGGHGNYASMGPLRGYKGTLYEGGIREPLIVRWPGVVAPGSESDAPVIGTDFFPTLLEIAGAAPPDGKILDGMSITPILKGQPPPRREALFWHFPAYLENIAQREGPWRTTPVGIVRAGDFKLLEFFEDGRLELYDLARDVGESKNLAARMPAKVAQLKQLMVDWRADIGAPVPTQLNPEFRSE